MFVGRIHDGAPRSISGAIPYCMGEVRGLGLMMGMDIVDDGEVGATGKVLRDKLVEDAFYAGLLLLGCGEATMRFCPPLCITQVKRRRPGYSVARDQGAGHCSVRNRMVSTRLVFALTALMLAIGSFASAVELPNTHFKPLGPEVDLTLKDATSRRGYLLSFVNGIITMELESGERLMKESNEITSLHFIPKIQPLTARQTELSGLEMQKVKDFQLQERKSSQDRKPGLSKAEEAEFRRLRKKVGFTSKRLSANFLTFTLPTKRENILRNWYIIMRTTACSRWKLKAP